MSTVVDERIVSIEFDNKHFEQNVGTTLQSLGELKKSLNFDGAAKGLDGINTATRRIDLSILGSAVDKVGLKFNALYTMADQALRGITNSAMAAGKRIVSSLTIQPVKTGLQEYETQLNSVQTILANTESKGSTLQDVNRALDELNTYADKTIYNFTEMTRNIGTFTAAGVDLDTSVAAIKGIANLAAISGSTSQQASTAMYQLSQALSSGTVRLMDWNSVVNAGMGGQVFQDALKETAKVHGIAIDQIIKDQGSFRESLKEGWLSSEILTETLSKFTGDLNEEQLKSKGYTAEQIQEILKLGKTANDAATKVKTFSQLLDTMKESAQSGWAQTWKIIVGDFNEAKELWTNVSNAMGGIIGGMSDARNELLGGAFSTGWKQLLGKGIMDEEGYIHQIKEIVKERKNLDMDELITDTNTFEDVLKSLLNDGTITSDMLTDALGNLNGAIGDMSDEYKKNMGYTNDQVEALEKLNEAVQKGDISMTEYVKKIKRLSGRELLINAEYDEDGMLIINERTGALVKLFKLLGDIIKPVKEAFIEIFPPTTSDQLYSLLQRFQEFTSRLTITEEVADKIKRTFKGLFAVIDIGLTLGKAAFDILKGVLKVLFPLSGTILDASASLGDFLVSLRDSIKEGTALGKFVDWTVWAFGSLVTVLKNFGKTLVGVFKKPTWFDGFIKAVKNVWNVTKNIFKKMGEFIKSFAKKVREYITEHLTMKDMKEGFGLAAAGGIAAIVMSILSFIRKLIKKFKKFNFDSILKPFKNIMGELQNTLQTFQQKIKAEALITIAKALVMLVASIIILSFVDTNKVMMAIASIGMLLGMLVGALYLINNMSDKVTKVKAMEQVGTTFKKFTNLKEMIVSSGRDTAKTIKMTSSLISLAAAVLLLAIAMKKVSSMSWSEIGRGLVGIGGCLVILLGTIALLNVMSRMKVGDTKSIGRIVGLVGILTMMSVILKTLSKLSWGEMGRALVAMTSTLSVLIGSIALLNVISRMKVGDSKSIGRIMALAGVLTVMAVVLKILGTLSWDEMGRGLVAMTSTLAILIGSIALLNVISRMKVGDAKSVGRMMALAGVLTAIAVVLKLLSTIEWKQIKQGLFAMSVALGTLVGLIALLNVISKIDGTSSGIGQILALTGSLVAVSLVLKLLSTMEWNDIKQGLFAMTIALGTLVGTLALLAVISNFSGGSLAGIAASLLIIAAAVSTLVPIIALLGSMKTETLAKGLIAIALALGIFVAAAYALQGVGPGLLAAAGALALFGAACVLVGAGIMMVGAGIGTLVAAITVNASLLVDALLGIVEGIINLLPNLTAKLGECLEIILQDIIDTAPLLTEALITLVNSSLEALVKLTPEISEAAIELLIGVLDALAKKIPELAKSLFDVIVGILDALVEYGPTIIDKLFDFLIMVIDKIAERVPELIEAAVGLLMSVFEGIAAALEQIDPAVIMKGLEGIAIIAALLAALGVVGLLVPPAMAALTELGLFIAELALIISALGKLSQVEGFQELVKDGGNFLQVIGTAIGQLIGGIVGGIAVGITDSLPDLGTNLSKFMENLQPFIDGIKQLDPSMVSTAESLAKMILVLTAADLLDSLTSWFTGGSSLSDFGKDLGGFGSGIRDFANKVKGVDANSIKTAAEAGLTLANMAKEIPNSGGIVSWFTGDNNIEDFGKQLAGFGSGISSFYNKVKGLNVSAIKVAAEAGLTLAYMAKELPNSGGVISWFKGNNDMDDFGNQLAAFGTGISAFSNKVKGIDTSGVAVAAEAGKLIAQMAKELPNSGGVAGFFAGENDLNVFGNQLVAFGAGIRDFSGHVKGIDTSGVESAVEAGKLIAQMAKELPNSGGVAGFFAGNNDMNAFGAQLSSFGSAIKNFVNQTAGIGDVSDVVSKIESLKDAMETFSTTGFDSIDTTFGSSKTKISKSVSSMLDAAIDAVKDKTSKFVEVGEKFVEKFISGVKEYCKNVKTAFKQMVVDAIDAMKTENNYNKFYSTGKYFVQGFAAGISENQYLAAAKAEAMANAAAQAAKEALDEHSPSKVGYEIGDYFGIAFVDAVDSYGSKAYSAGYSMASSAKVGLQNAVSKISSLIENGIDANPTITPVLNLDNLATGAGLINDMFSMSPTVGALGKANTISSTMTNQNRGNDDVISAIDALNKTMKDSSNNQLSIGNINVDSGSELEQAMQTIIRFAKMERRM